MDYVWNPWHGCRKYSEGCRNCYVYRRDGSVGRDASEIARNRDFDLPVRRNRYGEYKIPHGSRIYTCMTSDFFLDLADEWRDEAWTMIRDRTDAHFVIITKRIERFDQCIPSDWGEGYENVSIMCTMEDQQACDIRFPILNRARIRHKYVVCEPLLSAIDMSAYLTGSVLGVIVGGESGEDARVCEYEWVLAIREQCIRAGVPFGFKQTGAKLRKDGRLYRIERRYQHQQAKKAGIDT